MRDIPSLTAIRGVAALWVVLHHITLSYLLVYAFQGYHPLILGLFKGFAVVDMFFVLSGFILTLVYHELNPAGLGNFALRRILRIFPLHLFVLAVLAALSLAHLANGQVELATLPIVAFMLSPYVGLTHGLWNPVIWSTGVELSCYLAFPLALPALRRLGLPALVLLALAAAYGAWLNQLTQTHNAGIWTGWGAILRGWSGFWLGVPVGLIALRVTLPRLVAILLELAALAGLGWACAHYYSPLVPLATAGLIWALTRQAGPASWLLRQRPMVFLGQVSFSLYMLQIPLLDVLSKLWPLPQSQVLGLRGALHLAAYLLALIALSALAYKFIERPGQRFHRVLRRPLA